MAMRHIATSGLVCITALTSCGCTGIDSSNNMWWRGNWWRSDRQLFRTPLPATGVPAI